MNLPSIRLLLLLIVMLGGAASAQEYPEKIADRIGDLGPRATNLTAIAVGVSTVGL